MSIDVSVIVPVYNAREHHAQCLDSLRRQTLKNIELICVNDGSTDDSPAILNDLARSDARIRVIHQENASAGAARNNGLACASGKYVIFLDADDFFEPEMLEQAFRCAEKNAADVVAFGYRTFDERTGEKTRFLKYRMPRGVFAPDALGKRLYTDCLTVPWNKLYLRSFVTENALRFQTIRKCNDVFFTALSVTLAKRMVYLRKCFVNYRVNNAGSLQGSVDKHVECALQSRTELKQELIRRGVFRGNVAAAFYELCLAAMGYFLRTTSMPAMRTLYDAFQPAMIPALFDSEEDFQRSYIARALYQSRSFEEFLFLLFEQSKNFVEPNKLSVRLGKSLLFLPRKLLRRFGVNC